jgi:hypothetical protein
MRLDLRSDGPYIIFDLIQGREREPIVAAIEMSEPRGHLGQRLAHDTDANRSIGQQVGARYEARARSTKETAGYL